MREVVVISGKGGTGKTSMVAAFAALAGNKVLCDADVDASDLHLVMSPEIRERHAFTGGHTAIIHNEKCTECGLCRDKCRWNAISEDFTVNAISCEGCGVCWYFCPERAIDFPEKTCGEWFISDTRFGPLVHARLGIAEENSGKLVTLARQEARKLGEAQGLGLILTDGPPGVGCPVIASIGGATAVLVVAEPTVSGRHDMQRVAQLAAHFGVPTLLCVNKSDLNSEQADAIEQVARAHHITVLERIPFDSAFTKAMVLGQTIVESDGNSEGCRAVGRVWNQLKNFLDL